MSTISARKMSRSALWVIIVLRGRSTSKRVDTRAGCATDSKLGISTDSTTALNEHLGTIRRASAALHGYLGKMESASSALCSAIVRLLD
jgi:hypothetical protein